MGTRQTVKAHARQSIGTRKTVMRRTEVGARDANARVAEELRAELPDGCARVEEAPFASCLRRGMGGLWSQGYLGH